MFLYTILSVLYAYGLTIYSESKVLYTIFTLVYFSLLFSALYKPISYSYVFLSIFLFLGMWLKLTLHLIFDYRYVEPIGAFYTANARMDSVLLIAIIGAIGVISSSIIYRLTKLKSTIYIYENYIFKKPIIYKFYDTYRIYIYIIILFITLMLVYLNIVYQIQLTGIVPKTILIYPLNAIISWTIGTGLSVLLLVLFSLDVKFKNALEIKYLVFFAFIVAITSIGLLSRGQYVFMLGAIIVFLLFNYNSLNNLSMKKLLIYISSVAFLYIFVIHNVSLLRGYYFSDISIQSSIQGFSIPESSIPESSIPESSIQESSIQESSIQESSIQESSIQESSIQGFSIPESLHKILRLAVDRWIGLEGLMAVSSYEHKSFELFLNALKTKATIGKIDIYQYISNAHYKDMDNMKFAFATIPGSMAFFYYTGSLLFVYFGMLVFSLVMLLLEYYLYLWYKSALLVSAIGMYLANAVAQFGLMPINFLKSMFFTFSFLLIFKLIKIKKV